MNFQIRSPAISDADDLGSVHVRAWQSAYRDGLMPDEYLDGLSIEERASMWRQWLSAEPRARAARLVAEVDLGKVVGFAMFGQAADEGSSDVGELYAINVEPTYWGTGVGVALLNAAVTALSGFGFKNACLWVHRDNRRARAFYEREGWLSTGIEREQDVLGVTVPEIRYSRSLA
jgi:GNAT superfamily N-acetyltransferase